jgi:hypothetical protein
MPDSSFGSPTNVLSWVASGGGPSSQVPMPVGRQAADGDRLCLVTAMSFWATGRGANPRGRAYLGSGYTGELVLPSGSRADDRGMQPMENRIFVNGGLGTVRLGWTPIFYAWGGGGSTYDGYSITRPGSLAGSIRFEQSPQAPRMLGATSSEDGRTSYPTFTMEGDTGGAARVTGYRIQIARDPNMTQGVETYDTPNGQPNIFGRNPGEVYYYRATCRTTFTDFAGKLGGEWSSVVGLRQNDPGQLGRIRRDSGFAQADARILTPSGWAQVDGRVRAADGWRQIGS